MKLTRDIQSLSVFKRDTSKFMRQMKKTKEPIVLTVNGKASMVVQDAESYEQLLRAKDRLETLEGIQRGLDDGRAGRVADSEEVFKRFESKYGVPCDE